MYGIFEGTVYARCGSHEDGRAAAVVGASFVPGHRFTVPFRVQSMPSKSFVVNGVNSKVQMTSEIGCAEDVAKGKWYMYSIVLLRLVYMQTPKVLSSTAPNIEVHEGCRISCICKKLR